MFIEEFETVDNIQEDMLRMLLKRLIIIATRLAKQPVPARTVNFPIQSWISFASLTCW